jgi:hypothetical protein
MADDDAVAGPRINVWPAVGRLDGFAEAVGVTKPDGEVGAVDLRGTVACRLPLLGHATEAGVHGPAGWSRRRMRYAVSAVLPASLMARLYAARDSSLRPSRRSSSARVAWKAW